MPEAFIPVAAEVGADFFGFAAADAAMGAAATGAGIGAGGAAALAAGGIEVGADVAAGSSLFSDAAALAAAHPVATSVLGNVAGTVVSSALSKSGMPRVGSPQTTLGPTPVMPLPDDRAVMAARKKSIAAQTLNQGRASTILGGDSQKLGA